MVTDATRLAGVYLLTPDSDSNSFDSVFSVVEQALDAGVRVVQYRDKTSGDQQRLDRACRLVALAHAAGALLIVNDNVEIATDSGADGVHLGRQDGDLANARRRLPDRLLCVSCYNQIERAHDAIVAGADAVAFGSMFTSATKPTAVRAPLAMLAQARALWPHRRIIAIGGIDAQRIATVAAAGADAAAVLNAIFGAQDPARAARELVRQFDQGRRTHEEQRTPV